MMAGALPKYASAGVTLAMRRRISDGRARSHPVRRHHQNRARATADCLVNAAQIGGERIPGVARHSGRHVLWFNEETWSAAVGDEIGRKSGRIAHGIIPAGLKTELLAHDSAVAVGKQLDGSKNLWCLGWIYDSGFP